jgi:hypothetical protein
MLTHVIQYSQVPYSGIFLFSTYHSIDQLLLLQEQRHLKAPMNRSTPQSLYQFFDFLFAGL